MGAATDIRPAAKPFRRKSDLRAGESGESWETIMFELPPEADAHQQHPTP
jgi:hypothetical protein